MDDPLPSILIVFGIILSFFIGGIIFSSVYQNSIVKVCATKGTFTIDSVVINCEIQKEK